MEIKKVNKNKKMISIAIIAILLLIVISFSLTKNIIKSNKEKTKAEELSKFYWETKMFTVNDDYTYTFLCLVTVQEIEGIETNPAINQTLAPNEPVALVTFSVEMGKSTTFINLFLLYFLDI